MKNIENLHNQIVNRLHAGASFEELVEIVLHFKAHGLSQQAAYDTLEEIQRDLSVAAIDEEYPLRDLLEGLMDRVWGYCSAQDAIWDSSLSGKAVK